MPLRAFISAEERVLAPYLLDRSSEKVVAQTTPVSFHFAVGLDVVRNEASTLAWRPNIAKRGIEGIAVSDYCVAGNRFECGKFAGWDRPKQLLIFTG